MYSLLSEQGYLVFCEISKLGGNKTAFYHQQMLLRILHGHKHAVRCGAAGTVSLWWDSVLPSQTPTQSA